MIETYSDKKFNILGRGTVFVINMDSIGNGIINIGDHIKINDIEWMIQGIETTSILTSPPKRLKTVGLIVSKFINQG